MEAKFGHKGPQIFGSASDMKAAGKKKMEWDLNNWKWDGDMFRAVPLNSVPPDYESRQLFPSGLGKSAEADMHNEKANRELEKRRRVVVIDDEEINDGSGSPNLKLGGQAYPITEGETLRLVERNGKKTKFDGTSSNSVGCQVVDCRADLSSAKDYHRRHKVCEVHSKANSALVGDVMQRFCQQCSRFHVLQEFDEGKRSCRRRLAGHNRRRRKTHPENATSAISLNDERSSSYLLISLLRILSNIQSNSSDQSKDKDLLSHLLTNLASLAGTANPRNFRELLNKSHDLQDAGASIRTQGQDSSRPTGQKRGLVDVAHDRFLLPQQADVPTPMSEDTSANGNDLHTSVGRMKLKNIDLNNVYDDSEDCMEKLEEFDVPVNVVTHQDLYRATAPQTSGNSGLLSTQSPSSSSGEALSRTDRIVFKLFGQDPSRIPLDLRSQILAWLAVTPTEVESYIRPGCIILTIYLQMEMSSWEELCCDLGCSLTKLLDSSSDSFWKTGWIYARVQHHIAFVYDGHLILDTLLPLKDDKNCEILSIKPIAVSVSETAGFMVKGFNISRSNTRLLCALEGKYLVQKNCSNLMEGTGSLSVHEEEVQSISFQCSIPDVTGRGFIEVEDHSLSSSFFPFIVAEQDVCSEICTLESTIEGAESADRLNGVIEKSEASTIALDFVHELGWLLHRHDLKFRLGPMDPNQNLFSFRRFRFIMEFSLDHDWCAVVKKLLGILLGGTVDAGEHSSVELALLEMGLLHRAVRRNCRPMVEALLCYHPEKVVDKFGSDQKQTLGPYLFRPDAVGPGGLTPLHIAASGDGSESVLDALTDDPELVGIEAWRNARDTTGLTPLDYACQRGHYSYIQMVQTKIRKKSGNGHVSIDVPNSLLDSNMKNPKLKSTKLGILETEKTAMKHVDKRCNSCDKKLAYGNLRKFRTDIAFYRPALLSMLAIATVCVCAALLFKSSPEVHFVFEPFRWEYVKFGSS